MGMVRGGGYLALPLGAPSRGVVGPRPTEGLPDFGLLPIGKREGDVKKTPVIPPKGTRRQINESWYAAVARPVTDVTGRGNPFFGRQYVFVWRKGERIATSLRSSQ